MISTRTLLSVGAALVIAASYLFCFKFGEVVGESTVQKEWDKSVADYSAQVSKLKDGLHLKEIEHATKTEELTHALAQARINYENALASHRLDYDKRLLLVENRASTYRNQANGTADERDTLAEHAARLDRSLEEGRGLVRELGETIRQRELTITRLVQQIQLDRKLFTE
ncbi:MAG: hypothetical protein WC117_00030 [Sphaerochaetaceae bacterium]|jgi:hypothetical protein